MGRVNKVQGTASCEVCGKSGEQCFEVHLGGEKHVFDSFECAIGGLMPKCVLCGRPILGPGVQDGDVFYCSNLCASLYSVHEYEARILLGERTNPYIDRL